MKKFLLIIALWMQLPLIADCCADWKVDWCKLTSAAWWRCGWDAQVRIGAFHPQYHLFRQIYGRWGIEYEGEASKYLTTRFCGDLYLWGNLSYYSSKGHSVGLGNKTRIYVVPISVGLKYSYAIRECTHLYTGLGVAYTILRIHDQSPFVRRRTNREGGGVVVKFGVRHYLTCQFFVEGFADYLYQRFNFHSHRFIHRHRAEVGGWKLGAGFGMVF